MQLDPYKVQWRFMFKLAPPKTLSHSPSLDKQTHTGLTLDGGYLGRSGSGRSGRWHKCWSRSPCRPGPPGQRPSGGMASPVHHYLHQTYTLSTSSHVRETQTISSTNTVSPLHTRISRVSHFLLGKDNMQNQSLNNHFWQTKSGTPSGWESPHAWLNTE